MVWGVFFSFAYSMYVWQIKKKTGKKVNEMFPDDPLSFLSQVPVRFLPSHRQLELSVTWGALGDTAAPCSTSLRTMNNTDAAFSRHWLYYCSSTQNSRQTMTESANEVFRVIEIQLKRNNFHLMSTHWPHFCYEETLESTFGLGYKEKESVFSSIRYTFNV